MSRRVGAGVGWLERVLRDYDPCGPGVPVPRPTSKGIGRSLPLTVDPALGFSTRRSRSDGLVTHRTNVSVREPRFAVLLASLGAARFLRALPVAGEQVAFFVPLAEEIRLSAEANLPLLTPVGYPLEQALALRWLEYAQEPGEGVCWKGLAYQALQRQGAQQSIPRERGLLDFTWWHRLQPETRASFSAAWKPLLSAPAERHPYEIDHLLEALLRRRAAAWRDHLYDLACCLHAGLGTAVLPYDYDAVKEITAMIQPSPPAALAAILERREGTLRFGHALRLLGQVNASALRDRVEELESVQALDQLLLAQAQIGQDCQVAAAKTPFMLVPSDEDLQYLLGDVERLGVPTVARFLVTLAALRYPRLEVGPQDAQRLARLNLLLLAALASSLPEET